MIVDWLCGVLGPRGGTSTEVEAKADAILSALAAAGFDPPTRWQPIETAEKTGEVRLLAHEGGHYFSLVGFWGYGGVRTEGTPDGVHMWRDGCRWRPLVPQPTHWRPLPAPPAPPTEQQEKK